jgi:L-cysteine desulfidase
MLSIDPTLQKKILDLIQREVVPATGCTEPVAVALTTAYAADALGQINPDELKQIKVLLSPNVLKNALGVGIPGTGMIGLPIAIALGAVIAAPEKQLTVLEGFGNDQLLRAKKLVESGIIDIAVKPGDVDKLYIEVIITDKKGEETSAIIAGTHTRLVSLKHNGKELSAAPTESCGTTEAQTNDEEDPKLTFDLVYDFAMEMPLEKIEFIMEAARLNKAASEASMQTRYGHAVGRMIKGDLGLKYLGQNSLTNVLSATSAACDARMDGAPFTVMSNSGSGNQGITATLPVLTFAQEQGCTHEQTVRALMLSNLMVIYIKQKLGRLSALCGCVVASTGASCGLTYLLGGNRTQTGYAIKNMVGNITGMLCDGAKPSCSLKVSSGVSTAMLSALLAMEGSVVTSNEGVVDDDIDRTVDNLTNIGKEGMSATDKLVLDIMTSKKHA